MFLLKTVSLFGLDAVHWLFVLVVPIVMAIIAIIKMSQMRHIERDLSEALEEAEQTVRDHKVLPNNTPSSTLDAQIEHYQQDGKDLFDDRFLPDPQGYFAVDNLLEDHERRALSYWPAALFILLGLFGLVGAAASLTAIPPAVPAQNLPVLLFPLSTGLALAAYAAFKTHAIRNIIDVRTSQLTTAMISNLKVFRDKAGIATLINEMQAYDKRMSSQLAAFNDTAKRMADSEFSRGIENSVRDIMSGEIAPPIRQATDALTTLSTELAVKQEQGMATLATHFADSVSATLASHLQPLQEHLIAMKEQLAASEQYIESQVHVLETSRQQNIELNEQIYASLDLLAQSKETLVEEIEDIRGHLALLGVTTEKMTALYTGEESDLAAHINQLAAQLQNYAVRLDTSVGESSKALLAAAQLTERQDEASSIWLERLDQQLDRLSNLGQVIADNTNHFTKETENFVRKSLDEYDAGLAEVVERLTFTTAEIREAVDALPQALRPGI